MFLKALHDNYCKCDKRKKTIGILDKVNERVYLLTLILNCLCYNFSQVLVLRILSYIIKVCLAVTIAVLLISLISFECTRIPLISFTKGYTYLSENLIHD